MQSPWLLITAALVAANAPWISERVLFLFRPAGEKGAGMRLLEWLLMLALTAALAAGLERKATGAIKAQDWEFYVVNFFLFAVFSLPGILWRLGRRPR